MCIIDNVQEIGYTNFRGSIVRGNTLGHCAHSATSFLSPIDRVSHIVQINSIHCATALFNSENGYKLPSVFVYYIGSHGICSNGVFPFVKKGVEWNGVFSDIPNYRPKSGICQKTATIQSMADTAGSNTDFPSRVCVTYKYFPVFLDAREAGVFHANRNNISSINFPVCSTHSLNIGKSGHTHVRKRSQEIVGVYAPVFGKVYAFVSFQ